MERKGEKFMKLVPSPLGTGRICQDDVDSSLDNRIRWISLPGSGKETLQLSFYPSAGRHVRICDPIFYCSCRLNMATLFNSVVSHEKIYAIVPPICQVVSRFSRRDSCVSTSGGISEADIITNYWNITIVMCNTYVRARW